MAFRSEEIAAALARLKPEQKAQAVEIAKEAFARGLIERAVPPFREWLPNISPDFMWHFPHIQLICDELDILEASENGRLILSMPPRHTKSELVTIRYSAYNLLRNPKNRIIIGCYNKDLACKFSGETRKIAREAGVEISKETNAMDEWATLAGGGLTAVGVGSGVTGRGAECITEGTLIETSVGCVPIEQLQLLPSSCKILTVNHAEGTLEYKSLQAITNRETAWVYRITTNSGRVLEVTGNHRIYANNRYVYADILSEGDTILQLLPQRVSKNGIRRNEGHKKRTRRQLLLKGMLREPSRSKESSSVQDMRKANSTKDARLLRRLQRHSPKEESKQSSSNRKGVSNLRENILGGVERREYCNQIRFLLHKKVLGNRALKANVWSEQSEMETRCNSTARATSFCEGISSNETSGVRARRAHVRGVQNKGRPYTRASHRQLADEQLCVKYGHVMPKMPRPVAQGCGLRAGYDTVAMVERIRKETCVYDIQVEDNQNFFAGGICVHNCVIIDDPVKSRAEAESELQRNSVWNWYRDDIFTRLQPNGKIIIIMTRWHQDDLVGRILASENADLWRVVNLPALAEDNDVLGRSRGEALAEEWYSQRRLLEIKKELGVASFTSLYQGKPTPDGGSRFRAEWFKYYREEQDRYLLSTSASAWKAVQKKDIRKFQIVDVAATENKRSDYFVVKTYGVTPNLDLLYLDMYREKAETVRHVDIVTSQFNKHNPEFVGIENESYGITLVQSLLKSGIPIVKLSADRDKYSRTLTAVSMYEGGRIYHPQGAFWMSDVESELLQFPWGAHDDIVDCISYAAIKVQDYDKREDTIEEEEQVPIEGRTLESIEDVKSYWNKQSATQMEGYEW